MSRRWLCAVLAAVVALPLWVLPHSAVQAAVDDVEFTRLSGPTRYSTSVQVAEAYMDHVDELPDGPRVDTVIMGSGLDEHFGWAAPVPLLSKLRRAPLVFTRPDDVPVPVEQFLKRRHVRTVILLGGTGVISSVVERELADLGVEEIERLGSDDVFSHAVAVAESFDHPAGQLAGKGRTVLLASGTVFADALAAGPMAYQGEYPILLTERDRLHPAVADYLIASDVEHVRILGGPQGVGLSVLQTLSGLDFTSDRIEGRDRYGTAVKLAEAQLAGDGLRPCFDGAELGLAFGGLSPDALVSGPLLGEQCAPLLLSPADTLPRTLASFLRSDKWVTGDADNDLEVTVFGGTAVVPAEVVAQFLERATTLVPIGGRISVELEPGPDPDEPPTATRFMVSFDNDIDADKIAGAVGSGLFRVNYERVFDNCELDADDQDQDLLYGCARVRLGRVTVVLDVTGDRRLKPGDLITVTAGHRIGTNDSARPTARFSYVIPEPGEPADIGAPDIEIIAPAGHNKFAVLVVEENPLDPAVLTSAELVERITVRTADGSFKSFSDVSASDIEEAKTGSRKEDETGTRAKHQRYLFELSDVAILEPGDAITVPRGTFRDEDGRANPRRRHVVREPSTDFRIESVTVGDVDSTNQAQAELGAGTQLNAAPAGSLTITARSDGIAAGGRGNAWRIYGVGLPEIDDGEDAPEIDCSDPEESCITVEVETTTRLVRYRIQAGEPTFADLERALTAHRVFAANFVAEAATPEDDDDGGTIGGTVRAGVQFGGGGTAVGLRVRFSDPVKELLDAAVPRAPLAAVDCRTIPLVADLVPQLDADRVDTCLLQFDAPDLVVHMKLNAASVSRLPAQGDLVFINGSAANDYNGRPSAPQGWLTIRYDAAVPVS